MITKIFITVPLFVLFAIGIFISSVSFDVNYAEARLSTDPCSFKDYGKEMTKFLKISYDPSGVGKHVCKTTLEVWGIDKPVPARCGIVAGLYLTDPACKPEPDTEPESEPVAKLDSDNDGIPDSRDHCPNQSETKNGYNDHDGCPDEQPTPTPAPAPTPTPTPTPKSDNPWQIVGIIIVALIVLYVANKIRKKIRGRPDSRYDRLPKTSPKEKHAWSTNESEYWNNLSQAKRIQICEDLGINIKNAKKNLEKTRGDEKSKIIKKIVQMMSSGKIREINRQYNQWENEFQNKYDKLEEQKNYYKDKLAQVLAVGTSSNEEIEELKQRILDLEDRLEEGTVQKKEHDNYSENANEWQILGIQPGSSEDKIKKAYQTKALLWHPDKHRYETSEMKFFAELQFKRVKEAYDELMSR